jgi:hypothetical protein
VLRRPDAATARAGLVFDSVSAKAQSAEDSGLEISQRRYCRRSMRPGIVAAGAAAVSPTAGGEGNDAAMGLPDLTAGARSLFGCDAI